MQMPALQELKTPEYLQQLQEQSTDQSLWEVGASCNFLIAAARLGMSCSAVANLGEDVYGRYLLDILQVCSYCFFARCLYRHLRRASGRQPSCFRHLHHASGC